MSQDQAQAMRLTSPTALLLNLGHALDHLFLLIFATAVSAIALEFGFARWEDLMPYTTGAFVMFGIGSLPAGHLGDLWGRRAMMVVFFFGIGAAAIFVALARNEWQLALGLTLLGAFAAIYHPVGIPMLVQNARNPGFAIGVNGLAGNLGIAIAALLTGFFVKYIGWRAAFIVPGAISILLGCAFLVYAPRETRAPAQRAGRTLALPPRVMARIFAVMSLTAISGSLIFNFTTNGNGELLRERFRGAIEDPASLGILLAIVYAVASFTQVAVGKLIDRVPLKPLYLGIVLCQAPLFALAAYSDGWLLFALAIGFMIAAFGAIPFTDAMIVRYIDDRLRSRVAGVRLAVSFGISSLAVYLLGPVVKASGFAALLLTMAAISACTAIFVSFLPGERALRTRPAAAE